MATLTGEPAPARPAYVRVCPVCDTANPPERARCVCGASLAGVDFSLLVPPVPDAGVARAGNDAPEAPAQAGETSPAPASVDALLPVTDTASATPAPDAVATATITSDPPAAATIACPHADCGQPNPASADRCLYCNRPLHAEADVEGARPLPRALRDAYRVIEAFPATGSEADILLVVDRKTGDKVVAKLYRKGIQPDFRLLGILAQAVGDTVVKVLGHGVSDGAAYELLEYVPGGTLEDLLRRGPLPMSDVRRIVAQVADALHGIHAQRILHRDLKPDNVLVRSAQPLALALTDFGIASFATATQHFTSAARTTKYAAPEVLTGVLDAKSDWWSLGMIVMEAASGRHPFDGLSEQVMNHHLATRPIDVRGIFDDDLRLLCRGLLLRDPKRRFGASEVSRWLAGDATLAMPVETEGTPTAVRPYRIGKTEATTGPELALALARHWDAARRDLQRGHIARWLEQELHDHNLLRTLRDAQDQRALSDDGRLLRFLVAAAPDLPPIWRGSPVTADAVLAAAYAAARGESSAIDWLDSLQRDDVLVTCAPRDPSLQELDARWQAAWRAFADRWEVSRRAEEAEAAATKKRHLESGGAVNFDDLVYAHPTSLDVPPRRLVNGPLLVAGVDPGYVDGLRGEVVAAIAAAEGAWAWFGALWDGAHEAPADVLVAHMLLPNLREAARHDKRRRAATAQARARTRAEAQSQLRAYVARILELLPPGNENIAPESIDALLEAFEGLQNTCIAVAGLEDDDEAYATLRESAEKLASYGASAQRALARIEAAQGTSAIFFTRQRITGAMIVLGIAIMLRQPLVLVGLLVVAGVVLAFRWYSAFHTTETALARLRVFGLHGRTFLRGTDPPEESTRADGTRSRSR